MTDISKNYADVVKNIRSQARVFDAIINLADELEQLGSLNSAAKEATNRLGGLRDEESALTSSIAGLKADIAKLTGKKSEAQIKADGLVAAAQDEAFRIKQAADAEGQKMIQAARNAISMAQADADARLSNTNLAVERARAELQALNDEIVAKAQESSALQKAIDAIKKKFS